MGVGQAAVNFLDAAYGQNVAGGLAGEFVGAVAGSDGNGQGVQLGLADKVGRLLGVGQKLVHGHGGVGAVAVFLVALHGFERPQTAELALHRHTDLVRQGHHLAGNLHVVFVAGNGFAVGLQAAVHHHRAETQVNRALADGRALAMVLVHHQRDVGVGLDGRLDQMLDKGLTRVFAGTGTGLQNNRRTGFVCRRHNRLHLLEVIDVKSRNAVAVGGGVVKQFTHGNECHKCVLPRIDGGGRGSGNGLVTGRFGDSIGCRIGQTPPEPWCCQRPVRPPGPRSSPWTGCPSPAQQRAADPRGLSRPGVPPGHPHSPALAQG